MLYYFIGLRDRYINFHVKYEARHNGLIGNTGPTATLNTETMDNFAENVSKHFGLPWTGLIEQCKKTKKEKPPGNFPQDSVGMINHTVVKT